MKILFFVITLGNGGAEKVLIDTVKHLNKDKYKITVISLFNEGIYCDIIKEFAEYKYIFDKHFDNKFIRKSIKRILFALFKICSPILLHKILIRDKYDIEVAFLEGLSTKVISGAKDVKKIAWVHTDLITFPWSLRSYLNLEQEISAYKTFDNILCVSNQVKDAFEKKFGLKANVQHNVLDDKEIIRKSLEIVKDINKLNEFKIISVGRLTPIKGYDRLLRIHKKLINEGFNYKLYILGKGNEEEKLKKYIKDNNLSDSVELLGFKKNPYKYMKRADLYVCSSIAEGFSTVVIEATILGIPVVTTNCAGMLDILGDSEFGLITENNEKGLYLGLKEILSSDKIYNYYKKKSKERSKDFSLEVRIKEYEMLFDDFKVENK